MKNTVYSVARNSTATSMEEYAQELIDFILARNSQVASASVVIESTQWNRIVIDGKPRLTSSFAAPTNTDDCGLTLAKRTLRDSFRLQKSGRNEDYRLCIRGLHSGRADDVEADQRPPLLHRNHSAVAI